MKAEVKLITPAIAEDILSKNSMNRKPLKSKVLEYSRMMSCNLWKEETGESIKLATDGTLLDGQQRLLALIKSGISLNFLVITGLEKEVFNVIDTGKTRTAGDIFTISGIPSANNVSGIISRYIALKKEGISIDRASLYQIKISKSELLALYNKRSKFWDATCNMSGVWYNHSSRILSLTEFGGLYSFLYDINNDDSFLFFDKLSNGVGLTQKHPIKQLREKLIFAKTNVKFNFTGNQRLALIYKAWNLFRDKKEINFLKFNPETDLFPIPK